MSLAVELACVLLSWHPFAVTVVVAELICVICEQFLPCAV